MFDPGWIDMPNDHTPRALYVDHLDTRSRGQNLKGNIKEESQAIDITFIRQVGVLSFLSFFRSFFDLKQDRTKKKLTRKRNSWNRRKYKKFATYRNNKIAQNNYPIKFVIEPTQFSSFPFIFTGSHEQVIFFSSKLSSFAVHDREQQRRLASNYGGSSTIEGLSFRDV